MAQFNIHLTPDFEKNLRSYMKKKGISRKSEALRQALAEATSLLKKREGLTDFGNWLGIGLQAPLNPKPPFKNEDELWS